LSKVLRETVLKSPESYEVIFQGTRLNINRDEKCGSMNAIIWPSEQCRLIVCFTSTSLPARNW